MSNGILMQAQMLIDNEDYDKAYEMLTNLYEKMKDDAEYLEKIALLAKTMEKEEDAAKYWEEFMEMVELNYILMTQYEGVEISFKSNNPTIVDETGRIVNAPAKTTTVSYEVTVTLGGVSKTITLYTIVPGTTTWSQWDGARHVSQKWNTDLEFGKEK